MYYKRDHCDVCGYTVEFFRDGSQAGHGDGCPVGAATIPPDQRPVRVKYLVESGPADRRKAVGDEEDVSPAAASTLVAHKHAEYVEVEPPKDEERVRVRHLTGENADQESSLPPAVADQLVRDGQARRLPRRVAVRYTTGPRSGQEFDVEEAEAQRLIAAGEATKVDTTKPEPGV